MDEGATVVHIEFQRAAEPDFPLRMLDYYVRLRRFHRRPVIQVVVVTGRGASIPSEVEMDAHSVRFVVLRPGDFDADFFLNTVPALAVFARHTEPDVEFLTATLKKIAELGRSAQNVLGTSDIGYAIALAKHRFAPSVIDSIQRLDGMSIAEFIADTPPGRELLERGIEQGRGEGLTPTDSCCIRSVGTVSPSSVSSGPAWRRSPTCASGCWPGRLIANGSGHPIECG